VEVYNPYEPVRDSIYDADEQYRHGMMYDLGKNVEIDLKEANYWFALAAEQGHIQAQYHLASHYFNGDGIQKDVEAGMHWLTKAAEHGYGVAQYKLAEIYTDGIGILVPKDSEKAEYWSKKESKISFLEDFE
jgi:uncharacterized protein